MPTTCIVLHPSLKIWSPFLFSFFEKLINSRRFQLKQLIILEVKFVVRLIPLGMTNFCSRFHLWRMEFSYFIRQHFGYFNCRALREYRLGTVLHDTWTANWFGRNHYFLFSYPPPKRCRLSESECAGKYYQLSVPGVTLTTNGFKALRGTFYPPPPSKTKAWIIFQSCCFVYQPIVLL